MQTPRMHGRAPSPRASGFTLVELLTVITIVAILMSIGIPSYRSVTVSSRTSTAINGLLGDLQFARSAALREGRPATACISTDGATCTGTEWQGGWIVFIDDDGDATVDAGTDTVIRVTRGLTGGYSFTDETARKAITFNRVGLALNLPAAGILLKLHDPKNNPAHTRCLAISMAGMMKAQKPATAPETCT